MVDRVGRVHRPPGRRAVARGRRHQFSTSTGRSNAATTSPTWPGSTARMAGCDVVVHLAAKVGLGVDLRDLDGYARDNDLGTAVVLRAAAETRVPRWSSRPRWWSTARAATPAPGTAGSRPAQRTADDLDAGSFEPRCPRCGGELEAGPDPGGRAARSAQRLRRDQGARRAPRRGLGHRDRRPLRRAALPQRVRPGASAEHAVRRRRRAVRQQHRPWRAAAGLRGRPAAPQLRPRRRRRAVPSSRPAPRRCRPG